MNYNNNAHSKVKESVSGFLPLHNHLDTWINDYLNNKKESK